MNHIVFDTFAFMAFFRDEPDADKVQELLDSLVDVPDTSGWMSATNLGEVYYMMYKKSGSAAAKKALEDIDDIGLNMITPDMTSILRAAALKSKYQLLYADAFAADLCLQIGGTVVTGDEEFEPLVQAEGLRIIKLPKK